MLEWMALAFLFFLGLIVGSHLNVLVLRFGFTESPSPRSECAQCAMRIRWYDLVPVVSYFLLQGRCRSCGSAISRQYPLVELATGVLFALAYLVRAPALAALPLLGFFALLTFLATAVAVAAYDIRHTLIPLPFVYFLAGSALMVRAADALAASSWQPLISAALGALLLAGFFGAISLISRQRGMGMGDAYVAAAIGVLLGPLQGAVGVILGVWIATAFYLILMALSHLHAFGLSRRLGMKTELPFAPWLLAGSFIALFTDVSLGFGALGPRFPW